MARILVIEKNRNHAELLKTFIAGAGHDVLVCPDGRSAWRQLTADPRAIDAIVLDSRLADGDGAALVHRLRASGALSRVPAVFCVVPPAARRLRELGIRDAWIVELPIRGRALVDALDAALRGAAHMAPAKAVVIAHPDHDARDEWADALEVEGVDVYTLDSARELLHRLEESLERPSRRRARRRPDLVLAWAHDDEHDGLAILRFRAAFGIDVPVVLLYDSALVESDWSTEASAHGAVAVVDVEDSETGVRAIMAALHLLRVPQLSGHAQS